MEFVAPPTRIIENKNPLVGIAEVTNTLAGRVEATTLLQDDNVVDLKIIVTTTLGDTT